MALRSDGNGSWIIKRTHAMIVFILLIVSATTSAVTIFGIEPIKEKIRIVIENDKCQDKEIIDLKTTKAVRDFQYDSILKELEKLNNKLDSIKK